MTWSIFLYGVLSSMVATALVGFLGYIFWKDSLFSRLNKATRVEEQAKQHKEALLGSRTILDDARKTIKAELYNKTDKDMTICNWFDAEMDKLRQNLDICIDQAEGINSSLAVLKNLGKDLK